MKMTIPKGAIININGKELTYTGLTGWDANGTYQLFEDSEMNSKKIEQSKFLKIINEET